MAAESSCIGEDGVKVSEGMGEVRADRGRFRVRVNLKTMIVLVACCGAIFWAGRVVLQSVPINRMVYAMRSGAVEDRRVAARELGMATLPEVGQAIPALIAALGDADDEVAAQAARSLGTAGVTAAAAPQNSALILAASEALGRALSDDPAEIRVAAAHSLGTIGSRAGITPPDALIRTLRDHPSEPMRAEAAAALGQYHTTTPGAIQALLDALVADAIPVRRACRTALRTQSLVPPPGLVPVLIQSLRAGRDARERFLAASLLGRLGPAALQAVPALVATSQEPLGPRPVALTEPVPVSIGGPGRFAGGRLPSEPVEEAPREWDPAGEAALALGRIAKGTVSSGEAVAALEKALQSEYPWRRGEAAHGLLTMEKEATAAVPALIVALTKVDAAQQDPGNGESWIVIALRELAPDSASAPQAIQALTKALDAWHGGLRGWAVDALGRFGPRAAAAAPRIRTLLEDSDRFVARNAKAALDAIEGKAPPLAAGAAGRPSGRRPSDPAQN
jgi:HEAT repeat protein